MRSGAIVIGGYINGLGVVRALAARGVPTAVITTKPYDIAHRSRWVGATAQLLDLEENPDGLLRLLEERQRDWAGWALFPTNDGALAALSQHHDRLSAHYRVIAPSAETADCFLDKARMLELAESVGLELPLCWGPADSATATREDIRFPVVVKPRVGYRFMSRFGVKLFVARDREELSLCVERLAQAGLDGLVFDLIPGPDSQIYAYCTYIDRDGAPRGGITIRKMRQSPPFFGVARVAEIVPEEKNLRDAAIALLRRIGFRGMAAAEFKIDPRDGRLCFFEVNGRSVIYNALLRKGGMDLTAMAWSENMDGRVEEQHARNWPGCWVNLHADALYSAFHRQQAPVSLADFVKPYRRPILEAVWATGDPLPFFTQWARTAREAATCIRRGTLTDRVAQHSPPPADDRTRLRRVGFIPPHEQPESVG